MEAELVTIGNEVLSGAIVNTNVAFLSQKLTQRGYVVVRHTTLPDEPHVLKKGLQEALTRSPIVITTGGLGPTIDDLTRSVAAEIFGSDFRFDESIAQDLKARFGTLAISLEDQATVPTKALVFPNRVGSAPALVFEGKLILLPGVPNEMRTFFNEDILPYLEKHYPVKDFEKEEELHFCFLTESTLDGKLRLLSERFPTVKVGIYPTTGTCSVRLTGSEAKSFAAQLTEFFPTYLMPHAKPEMALHELLTERRLTIACAESCTGGMIAEKITAQPGASAYFLGSLVVYGNECKRDILGVSEQTLQQYGAVSQEVVAEMFQGLMKVTKADYGMAVTGIAGPSGGTLEKPVGTVWAAIGQRGEQPDLWTFRLELNREGIILLTSNRLLSALYRKIFFGIRGGQ